MSVLALLLAFCLAIAIFAVQNTTVVQINFLWWKSQSLSLAILVIACVAVGAVLTFLISLPSQHRRRKELRQRERELSDLKDAIGKH